MVFFQRFAGLQQGRPNPAQAVPGTMAAPLSPGEDDILQELLARFANPGRSKDHGDA
jgi:hypothetical protein